MGVEDEKRWAPFEITNWENTTVFDDRIATEIDVKNGQAVFSLRNVNNHTIHPLGLPILAYLINEENDTKLLVVIIQAESTEKGILLGYRNPNGGSGVGFINEFIFV